MCICVSICLCPLLFCNLGVHLRVYNVYVHLASQGMYFCLYVYDYMSPWLRNLARYLSVCLYVYVALASHLGFVPVFSYVYDSMSMSL